MAEPKLEPCVKCTGPCREIAEQQKTKAQRDELLASCKEMVEFIRVRNITWRLTEKDGLLLCKKIGKATAAIEKAEGKESGNVENG